MRGVTVDGPTACVFHNVEDQFDEIAADLPETVLGELTFIDAGSTDNTFDRIVNWFKNGTARNAFWVAPEVAAGGQKSIEAALASQLVIDWDHTDLYGLDGEATAAVASRRDSGPVSGAISAVPIRSTAIDTSSAFANDVLLCPGARYHVDELIPIASRLAVRGLGSRVLLPPSGWEPIAVELSRYRVPTYAWPTDIESLPDFKSVLTLNDWGPARELVELAIDRGVPSFSKVEGVQDFGDLDTGRERHAYRRTDYVLGQGANDVDSLPERVVFVTGNTRLERIAAIPARRSQGKRVVINSNFTYNVLTDEREIWLTSVLEACRRVGADAVVSQHHADGPIPKEFPVATAPIRHLLVDADVLVSRFSTVPFEAIARGVTFIYHNPHGELVPTFARPDGAFSLTTDVGELADALERSFRDRPDMPSGAVGFFDRQIDITDVASEERSAATIDSILKKWFR